MRLFDSHCHLDFPDFDVDRGEVVARAHAAGVEDVLVPGYVLRDPAAARALATQAAARGVRVHHAVGLHPFALAEAGNHDWALPEGALAARLIAAAAQQRAVAIGECGLDVPLARRAPSETAPFSMPQQVAVLREHLAAAEAAHLPLILHVVRAHEPTLALLREGQPGSQTQRRVLGARDARPRGVVHAYSGSAELVREYERLGFSLAFGGALTHERHARAREAARAVSDERLLVESDAPSGRLSDGPARNEPSSVREVVLTLAALREQAPEHVAEITHRNACALFGVGQLA